MGSGVGSLDTEAREIRALLHLRRIPGLGDRGVRVVVDRHGSATAALRFLGVQGELLEGELREGEVLEWMAKGGEVLPLTSTRYPSSLRDLEDPPPLLFLRGRPELLGRPAVAIVGARRASEAGRRMAAATASLLARSGVVVVSGMARGIDAAAHEGARAVGGDTVAVLGCGLDVPYPRANRRLFRDLARNGLVMSEFLPSEPALPFHFPRRNRVIAALALAVVVVEAGKRSGALITVDHALDLAREVLAVPGSVENPQARGCNALLRDGARLLSHPGAVLEELEEVVAAARQGGGGPSPSSSTGPTEAPPVPSGLLPLWEALGSEPMSLDRVAEQAGLSPGDALAGLAAMELGGWARPCPGMRFRRP